MSATDLSLEEIIRKNVGAAVLAHQEVKHRSGDGKAIVPEIYGGRGAESPGEEFTQSAGYKDWVARFPDGGPASRGEYHGDPAAVTYRLGRQLVSRALVTSADASAGSLVRPDRGPLEPGLALPLTIRQLVAVIPVTSDQVDFPRETARPTAAAPVAEATALTGTTGLKPEGALTFELVQVPIRTIAEWVPATKRIVSDADFLSAYINTALIADIEETLEDQMLNGGGTGEDFLGILNTTGIGDAGAPGAGESALDMIREAKRLVQVDGRVNPTAVVINPEDLATIERYKRNNEVNNYLRDPWGSSPQPVLYGMPVIETPAIAAGTGLVGNFRKAVLFDRESVAIAVGTVGDDFIRNLVRVLGELRAGFTVARVKAFATFDMA